jgi:uncharacterized peroxidase-related enzyme
MSFIDTIAPEDADDEVNSMYRQLQGARSYLPNYAKVYCYRPQVMADWSVLQKTIQQTMDARRYELVTLAAAQTIDSSYCSLAHGQILEKHYYPGAAMTRIATNSDHSELDDADKAMMRFARKVADQASTTTQVDIDELRECGFSDEAIFDITAAAAARCFFAKIADALGALPDAALAGMGENLRQALTVGRPIENPDSQ